MEFSKIVWKISDWQVHVVCIWQFVWFLGVHAKSFHNNRKNSGNDRKKSGSFYKDTCLISIFLWSIMSVSHFSRNRNWPGSCWKRWPSNRKWISTGLPGSTLCTVNVKSTDAVICKRREQALKLFLVCSITSIQNQLIFIDQIYWYTSLTKLPCWIKKTIYDVTAKKFFVIQYSKTLQNI